MKLINQICRKFYLFILVPLLTSLLLLLAGKIKTNPKAYERVNVLISSVNLNNKLLEDEITKTNKVDVKEINITFSIYGSESLGLVYNTVYEQTDVFIFPKSFLDTNIENNHYHYAKLNEEVISRYISDSVFYEYKENKYAIKIYDSTTKKGYCDSLIKYEEGSFSEDYYMFFYYKSLNLGDINGSNYDNALKFLKAMSEYEN